MAAAFDRDKALEVALGQIDKQFGKGSVMRLGERAAAPIEVIPTGSIALDLALGIGGLPLQNSAGTPTKAILRAYQAGDLSNALYNSSQVSGDAPGYGIKFTSPVVANGRVYISTGIDLTTVSNPRGEIVVYGLK